MISRDYAEQTAFQGPIHFETKDSLSAMATIWKHFD
jgi:hypothetical protein